MFRPSSLANGVVLAKLVVIGSASCAAAVFYAAAPALNSFFLSPCLLNNNFFQYHARIPIAVEIDCIRNLSVREDAKPSMACFSLEIVIGCHRRIM